MFSFLRKNKQQTPRNETPKISVRQFTTLLLNDEKIMFPVYLPELRLLSDSDNLGIAPLIYIWNVSHSTGSFSLSVNGKCVGHLLETFVSRGSPDFQVYRDEAMKVISDVSLKTVQKIIHDTGLMPDELFSRPRL